MPNAPRALFIVIFLVSGFSGLIYESIWSHYLKLFLGHAAYAQSLVLMIFMGGMAIGAGVSARWSERIQNPLRAYAWIELGIGLLALVFHPLFVTLTDFAFTRVIPNLEGANTILTFKWLWAGSFILPQSILLGMTFPLMTTGLLRRFQANRGATVSLLYFSNSLGGAVGVLASGFVLIDLIGLPGTVVLAGLFNIGLAALVAVLAPDDMAGRPLSAEAGDATASQNSGFNLWLVVAFLTGTASFIYEIGWIRMLSLVLGSSTHAFELMLSAFILGIALGGFWIRNRIDRIQNRTRFLAVVQILMGVMAASTIILYGLTFEWMAALVQALPKTDQGYLLFNLGSHSIALFIMVPVTFFAGMTLPLLTHICIQGGKGETSVGSIYAANTLGAILGVLLAVHVGLPQLGLKGTILAGSVIDLGLGVVLLSRLQQEGKRVWHWFGSVTAALALVVIGTGVGFDANKLASGVFRTGDLLNSETEAVVAHRDGKTASISIVRHAGQAMSIRTNGKPDASVNMGEGRASDDEVTMTLTGILPAVLHGQAKTVANIGFGSGMTTHAVLADPGIEHLDNIEIEPQMVRLAEHFRPLNERAYSDPRNRFYYDDAKTLFSMYGRRYDLIISEPSNPWVSGVSSLFTEEFYRYVARHLAPNGLFAQWIQFYESDFEIAGSILKALDRVFGDYSLFMINNGDMIIVASMNRPVPSVFDLKGLPSYYHHDLSRVDVVRVEDLQYRFVGNKELLSPFWAQIEGPVNSDYRPFVDQNAARARFLSSHMTEFLFPYETTYPTAELFWPRVDPDRVRLTPLFRLLHSRVVSLAMRDRILQPMQVVPPLNPAFGDEIEQSLSKAIQVVDACRTAPDHGDRIYVLHQIMARLIPHLSAGDLRRVWSELENWDCVRSIRHSVEKSWLTLLQQLSVRDWRQAGATAEHLLETGGHMTKQRGRYLLSTAIGGRYHSRDLSAMNSLWARYGSEFYASGDETPFGIRLLMAQANRVP